VAAGSRVTLYVDGFNLYYGALKGSPGLKWLDLCALARALRPQSAASVRYFTARIKPQADPAAPARQKLYLTALSTVPDLTVHFGAFRTHPRAMALVSPPPGGPTTVVVHKTEEKGSDVNLATYLLLDGIDGLYDEAPVITDDSDLAEPIRQANTRFGPVHVYSPRTAATSELRQVAASYTRLDPALLAASQLPPVIVLPSGAKITRPPTWT
jgi:uncharacterized LabA/DUF88 family protein